MYMYYSDDIISKNWSVHFLLGNLKQDEETTTVLDIVFCVLVTNIMNK